MRNHKLALDTTSEIYSLLAPWADFSFTDFSIHDVVPDAIYIIDRTQFIANKTRVLESVDRGVRFVLTNTHEGSDTLQGHVSQYGITDIIKSRRMLLIGGGDMDTSWPFLCYDSFLPKLFDYEENLSASVNNIFDKVNKPYKFLFLNGRGRRHRSYLIDRFGKNKLLDQALWTNLDSNIASIHYLPPQYEVERYQSYVGQQPLGHYAKFELFNNDWGEIYLAKAPYEDTYFSLVTETVFDYPYSFRTEKIWKPIAMAHPWIAVSNEGYYRDLHNLGFRTFGHVVDESFDLITDNQRRIERIATVVEDLCNQNMPEFLVTCQEVCKYNQQHLAHMRIQVRKEFPDRFFKFINQYYT